MGASGLVGRACMTAFGRMGDVVGTYHRRAAADMVAFDLTDAAAARALLARMTPRAVICAGADPHVEGCEIDPAGTRRINVEGTLRLAEAAAHANVPFVFFSTEYVFDGTKGPYAEDAPLSPINEYGRQKADVETALGRMPKALVARTSGVFGWSDDGKNFVLQLIARLGRGERMNVPDDQVITPTYAPNLGDVVVDLVDAGAAGLVHVAGAQPMNRVAFAQAAAKAFALDASLIDPTPTDALDLKAARPRNAGLTTAKAARLARTRLLTAEESLMTMRTQR